MTKVMIEIEIPVGYELADTKIRQANQGDSFLNPSSVGATVQTWCAREKSISQYIIVRKSWQWPDWLTAEWIAMDADGKWDAYSEEPHMHDHYWSPDEGMLIDLDMDILAFTPPPCIDWRQSKRRNPRSKEVTK